MHHFTSKVSVEKFQGDEHASLIPEYALIDKTSIFYAFDISRLVNTSRCFSLSSTLRSKKRERNKDNGFASFPLLRLGEETISLILNISRARITIRQDLKR